MANQFQDDVLQPFKVQTFSKGYNSYTGSNTLVDDQEIPVGANVYLDNNGAASKVQGSSQFTANELATGHAVYGLGWLKNPSFNKVVAPSNTAWYEVSTGVPSALTGVSFTADQDTDYCQAIDRLYGANGTDNLAWTSDASTLTSVSSNGNIGRFPVSYNRRLYMTNTAHPDRIYYSNPYGIDATASPNNYTTSYFGTFDTDLTQAIDGGNKKNAGFIILLPGGGVEISSIKLDTYAGTDYIYAFTKHHGTWRISYSSTNTDGTIVHTITHVDINIGSPSGRSPVKVGNDIWYFGYDNYYTLGDVAYYSNIRVSPKAGRIYSEVNSIAGAGTTKVAGVFFNNKLYYAYQTGTYNDRILIYDVVLNAWSTPRTGINASCFLVWEDNNGVRHLLSASSKSTDSRIHELTIGTNDNGSAISATFTTKSFDCGMPGLQKRFAFIDVFYSLVLGTLTYEVFLNETSSITGSVQLGTSQSAPDGIGSKTISSFPVGGEYSVTTASITRYSKFRIPCQYKAGKFISVKFTNNNLSETFKINGLIVYFIEGSIFEAP